jgi:hypothetical protein
MVERSKIEKYTTDLAGLFYNIVRPYLFKLITPFHRDFILSEGKLVLCTLKLWVSNIHNSQHTFHYISLPPMTILN